MSDDVGVTTVQLFIEREVDGLRTHVPAGALKVVVAVVDGDRALACADLTVEGARALARNLDGLADRLQENPAEDV
jgi:hypothetical protein